MTAIDGRSQTKVHTDERIQVDSARSSLTVTHSSTNRRRRCLTSVNVPYTELALVAIDFQGECRSYGSEVCDAMRPRSRDPVVTIFVPSCM